MNSHTHCRSALRYLTLGASLSALATTAAWAQSPDSDPDGFQDEIIVTGVRASLEQSLDFERASTTVVDAVTAEDVGKFPDNNVAEALQRITGVAIDRTGGDGQFITVRGLGPEFNIVTLNGRTLATDNDGREFSFDILSSDVIQRAEVYKTSDATLQSGGIGALVNVVTARPFDSRNPGITAQVSGTYDTLDKSISPEGSILGNWSNEDRTFGVVGSLSYSNRSATIDRVFTNGFALRTGDTIVDAPESSTGLTADDLGVLPAGARVQQQVVVSRDDQERERLTANGTIQFAPTDTFTLTLDGLYSEFTIDSFDSQFSGFFSPPFIDPVIDANGTVVSFSRPGVDFLARNPELADAGVGLSQNDNVITSNNRNADTYLFGANADWELSETVTANFDVSRSVATNDATNPFVVLGALAPESPLIQLPDYAEISTLTNIVGAQDTTIQRLHFVNVNRTQVEDEITELRGTLDWEAEFGPLVGVTLGASYTDRTKTQNIFDNFSPSVTPTTASSVRSNSMDSCRVSVAPTASQHRSLSRRSRKRSRCSTPTSISATRPGRAAGHSRMRNSSVAETPMRDRSSGSTRPTSTRLAASSSVRRSPPPSSTRSSRAISAACRSRPISVSGSRKRRSPPAVSTTL